MDFRGPRDRAVECFERLVLPRLVVYEDMGGFFLGIC